MSTLERLIQGLGIKTVGDQINVANFPDPHGKPPKEYKLYSYPTPITAITVLEMIEADGYTPADLYDLLQWAQENWNGQSFVIGLNSIYEYQMKNKAIPPVPSVPALLYRGTLKSKSLALDAMVQTWTPKANFLAVKRGK